MWPAERKPGTSRKYWIRVLTIKVVLQLNSDVLQGVCTVSYWTMKPSSGTTNTIQAQAGQQNMGKHYCEQLGMHFKKNAISPASSLYKVVFLPTDTMYTPGFTMHHCFSQLSLLTFKPPFYMVKITAKVYTVSMWYNWIYCLYLLVFIYSSYTVVCLFSSSKILSKKCLRKIIFGQTKLNKNNFTSAGGY